MIKLIKIIIILNICSKVLLFSQVENIDKDIQYNSDELNKIRNEISEFENKIKKTSSLEKNEIQRLNDIDEEISLVRNLIFRLRKEEKNHITNINSTDNDLKILEKNQQMLIDRYSKRVVKTYKKGRLTNIEKIIDSNSWRQAIYRSKYIKIISKHDKNLQQNIYFNIKEIESKRKSIEDKLEDLNLIDKEKTLRKKWLEQRRKVRNSKLENLKKDRQQIFIALSEKKRAALAYSFSPYYLFQFQFTQ